MNAEAPRAVRDLDDAFAACLDDLAAGLSLAETLARYPDYAEALTPLLMTAARLRDAEWPKLSMRSRVRGREQMHAALEKRQRRAGVAWWRPAWGQFGVALILVVLAAGVWLARPGRELRTVAQPTATSTVVALPADATLTPTATVSAVPTVQPEVIETRTQATPEARSTTIAPALTTPAAPPTGALVLATATATARPTGTRTRTPEPTEAPEPTHAAAPRPTGTRTSEPARTPEPVETPESTRTATPQPGGTRIPESTRTPEPTETRKPTKTPEPEETPEPTETADDAHAKVVR